MIEKDLLYTSEHEWIRRDKGPVTVGISDHAQEALGDITFVELPEIGRELAKGDEAAAIESAKAAASIYAPAGGKIVEVNRAVEDDPALVNAEPYGKGWIFKLDLKDPGELDSLMTAEQYEKHLAEQD